MCFPSPRESKLKAGYDAFVLVGVSCFGRLLLCRYADRWRCLVYEEEKPLDPWNEIALRNVRMAIKRGRKMGKVDGVMVSIEKIIEYQISSGIG